MSLYQLGLALLLPGFLLGQEQPVAAGAEPAPMERTEPVGLLQDAGMVRVAGSGIEEFEIDLYEFPNQRGALPRINVSWEEAAAACAERGKRLCAEQEWRRACAGPADLLYGYGSVFEPGRCNTPYPAAGVWRRGQGLARSGDFAGCASEYGVYDLIGNVWEWTAGRYTEDQDWRVVRGGSWFHNANLATSESRYGRYLSPDYRLDLIGFRCCRSAPDPGTPHP